MTTNSFSDSEPSARELVERMMARGYSAQKIADLMGQRVSWRTIYRWARGESTPHQPSNIEELKRVSAVLMNE